MFEEIFLIVLLGHVIGDFYVQTEKIAREKEEQYRYVLLHCVLYACTMAVVILPVFSQKMFVMAIAAAIVHFAVDSIKYLLAGIYQKHHAIDRIYKRNEFLTDQILHLATLVLLAYVTAGTGNPLTEMPCLKAFFAGIGVSEVLLVRWILALLLIDKLANILIQKLIGMYRPADQEGAETNTNAGCFIGVIERIIMLVLIAIGEFGTIGLVLTAKSIARYDRISKEQSFAEYYLLGTLLSTAIVIISSFVLG